MPDETDIHDLLAGFSDEVIAFLEAAGFFDIEGEYNPTEFYASIPKKAKDEYKAASKEKNSLVWDVVKAVVIGRAIGAGIKQFQKDYPVKFKSSAQDYMNGYVKEHGGEFITRMGKTDQQKMVNFIWANAGLHERVLAKKINEQPHLKYVLDQGKHRVETIVRTEKFRATEYGTWRTAQDNKFKTKTRLTAGDKRVRPSHRALHQLTVGIDEPFPNGEYFPGENSINCRCRIRYGFDLNKIDKNAAKTYESNLVAITKDEKAARAIARSVAPQITARKVGPEVKPKQVAPISPSQEFREAKTASELQKWAEKYHPGIEWKLAEGDLKTTKSFLAAFNSISKDFPQIKKDLSFIGFSDEVGEHAWMAAERIKYASGEVKTKLHLSPRLINPEKFNEDMQLAKKYNAHPSGTCDVAGRTAHECGHLLDYALMSDKKASAAINTFKANTKADKSLSLYAAEDVDEAWAEGFAENYFGTAAKHHAYSDKQYGLLEELGIV